MWKGPPRPLSGTAKAPIKMLFPTVLFIFPAMFVLILGPAMLRLQKILAF